MIFPKILSVIGMTVLIANGLLLGGFLALEIETQVHALVTRDERNGRVLSCTRPRRTEQDGVVAARHQR